MPRPVILDTDWFTDVDDVMAVRVLANYHIQGVFKLLGVGINSVFTDSVRSLDAFLLYSGLDLPVAIVRDFVSEAKARPTYQTALAKRHSKFSCNDDAELPVHMYRRLLAASPERVDIISIGFTENLVDLLQSQPDEFSPLDGLTLVREKVSELWIMAGRWDAAEGVEYNLHGRDGSNPRITNSAAILCDQWPTPVTFLGFEVGYTVISGADIPADDILKQAMIDHGSANGRCSWDPMTVMLAAAGSPAAAGYREVRGKASCNPVTGANTFAPDEHGPHRYVIKLHPDTYYRDQVNSMLGHLILQ